MKPIIILSLSILVISSFFSCNESKIKQKDQSSINVNPLKGAWEITMIHWISTDTTYTIKKAEPGLFFFTDMKYAIMWTPTRKPRVPFKELSKPTDAEFIAGFKSVVFNAGNYIFTDSTATATAMIAKVPGFEGGKQYYKYDIQDKTLNLTMYDETYPDGTKPSWSGKWKTKFVMKKVD